MLIVYSISIFFVSTWGGMAIYAVLFAIALAVSKVSASKVFSIVIPMYVIAGFTVVFNMFPYGDGGIAFSYEGLMRGCFYGVRILLLVWMSLVLCLSTTATELMQACVSLLSPLRFLRVPVDDIAMVFSIALRFIPLVVETFFAIRSAQWSRGACFDEGPITTRIKSYCAILIPLFVDMFRRADRLATAMDARCYGAPNVQRTNVRKHRLDR